MLKQRIKQAVPLRVQNTWRVRSWLRDGEPELHLLPVLCRRDRTMVDVGANYGVYTHVGRRHAGHVVAFEPQPALARAVRRAYRRRVTVHACGLSDEAGSFPLSIPVVRGRMVDSRASFIAGLNRTDEVTVDVPVRTLDSFDLQDVSLVKIDVEGLELPVLRGARDTLARCRPALIVEVEERMGSGAVATVTALMRDWGYDGFFMWRNALQPVERFSIPVHQPSGAHVEYGQAKLDDYVNNFVFLPADDPALRDRAVAAAGRD